MWLKAAAEQDSLPLQLCVSLLSPLSLIFLMILNSSELNLFFKGCLSSAPCPSGLEFKGACTLPKSHSHQTDYPKDSGQVFNGL